MADSQQYLFTDRQHLTTEAYGTSANLDARKAIYQYQQKSFDLLEWVLGHVAWRGDETVLDVGCGTGQYLRHLAQHPGMQVLGFDLSRGMLADLAQQWGDAPLPVRAVADAQALPLPDACCDVVLAMHMLYHVPYIALAAHEFRRVLQPGGVLLALTNGDEHLSRLHDVLSDAIDAVAGQPVACPPRFNEKFSLQNGAAPLQTVFAQVERQAFVGELAIPDPQPLLGYFNSMSSIRAALPQSISWDAVMAEIERRVTAEIAEHGVFRVQTASGVFVCR